MATHTRSAGARLRTRLETLGQRRTRCHFVFGRDEDGLVYLRRILGTEYVADLESLGMTIDIVDGVDHTFKPVWSHEVLRRSLESHLSLCSSTAPGGRSSRDSRRSEATFGVS